MGSFIELPSDNAAARRKLDELLAEELTAIGLVFGTSASADACWRNVKVQGGDENARGIRVRDVSVLTPTERREWLPTPNVLATFLTPDDPRRVSSKLTAPTATNVYDAFSTALAGRVA